MRIQVPLSMITGLRIANILPNRAEIFEINRVRAKPSVFAEDSLTGRPTVIFRLSEKSVRPAGQRPGDTSKEAGYGSKVAMRYRRA
jgi:hypothetical protein